MEAEYKMDETRETFRWKALPRCDESIGLSCLRCGDDVLRGNIIACISGIKKSSLGMRYG